MRGWKGLFAKKQLIFLSLLFPQAVQLYSMTIWLILNLYAENKFPVAYHSVTDVLITKWVGHASMIRRVGKRSLGLETRPFIE